MKLYDASAAILLFAAGILGLTNAEINERKNHPDKPKPPTGITYYVPADTTNVSEIVSRLNPGDSVVITQAKPAQELIPVVAQPAQLQIDEVKNGQAAPKNPNEPKGSQYVPVVNPNASPSPVISEEQAKRLAEAIKKIVDDSKQKKE